MSFVIDPLALIFVAGYVPERSLSMCFVEAPIALIPCPVLPNLNAATVPVLALPLTEVLRPVLEDELGSVLHLAIIVVLAGLQLVIWRAALR